MRPLITVADASVTLNGVPALRDVSVTIREGEHTILRGGNGAGKSTLLRLLRGEQWPDQGRGARITWHTEEGDETSPLAGRALAAIVAPSQQELVTIQGWDMHGEDFILGGLTDARYVTRPARGDERAAIVALAGELGTESLLGRRVSACSQGELRRLLVARAMIRRPKVLLLDEATDGLDGEARERLLALLTEAASRCTLVVGTHRPETLPPCMAREIVMNRGRIASDGPSARPGGTAEPSAYAGGSGLPERTDGRRASARIAITRATVYVNRVPVLRDIDWTIDPGQNWAVVGDNGAGKSTLMRLIAGDEHPALGGSIVRELAGAGGRAVLLSDVKRSIRLVSDLGQATYAYDLPGEALVLSGIDNSVGLYRELSDKERDEARRAMALLGVAHLRDRPIRRCSTGELRRLLIARAIVGSPDLILLDEPCSGLDPAARRHFVSLTDALPRQGVQIVLVTHHDGDVPPSVTHLLKLDHGRIVFRGPRTDLAT